MNTINITKLAEQTRDAQIAMGIQENTVWHNYFTAILPIVRLHKERSKEQFDYDIVREHMQKIENRLANGQYSVSTYRNMQRGAERLTEMHEKGKLEMTCRGRASKFVLNEYYEKILASFIQERKWHKNTREDVMWTAKKFFYWLIQNNHDDLSNVGANEIQRFIIFCSDTMRLSGVYNIKLYMKHLCDYLFRNGFLSNNFNGLLSFRINRETKLLPATPWSEIETVLQSIDRNTPKGKRDYAIIILASVTGLRAIDIVRLRLSDINWQLGEIKLTQSKTGEPVVLPLTRDVGEAIEDYILNGRYKTDCDAVFLTQHVPHRGFTDAVSIGEMYDEYRKKAGLPREAFDGRGFHSLRRNVATSLITADVPVTTVAQIIGDKDIRSTKKYISLDAKHLSECALDFTGIEPEAKQ